jgi:hypothetical protein
MKYWTSSSYRIGTKVSRKSDEDFFYARWLSRSLPLQADYLERNDRHSTR